MSSRTMNNIEPKFKVGEVIFVISSPTLTGYISQVIPPNLIIFGGISQYCYEIQYDHGDHGVLPENILCKDDFILLSEELTINNHDHQF